MTTEQVTKICGHSEPVPPFMGRGQARQKRIAQFASFKCDACHNAELVTFAARLTRLNGDHYTPAEQAAYVAKHARK